MQDKRVSQTGKTKKSLVQASTTASVDKRFEQELRKAVANLLYARTELTYDGMLQDGKKVSFNNGVLEIEEGPLVECLRLWCQEGDKDTISATIKFTPNPGAMINARC